jgi:phosphate transport system permease protein
MAWDFAQMGLWAIALSITAGFLWILGDLIFQGWQSVSWAFLTLAPEDTGRSGGIAPMLISTGLIILVCLGVALPLGLGTAIFLAEYTRTTDRWSRWIQRSLDILAGVPSIVFGLFGYAFFSQFLGLGFSILSGGLTLSCMVLPLLIRTTEAGLRAVPQHYRLSAAALGLSRTGTLTQLLLPAAMPSFAVGLVLSLGRALAETAALMFTSGYVDRLPSSLLDSGRALSVHIFDLAMNVPGGEQNAYGSALVLVVVLLIVNALANGLASGLAHHAGGRQAK